MSCLTYIYTRQCTLHRSVVLAFLFSLFLSFFGDEIPTWSPSDPNNSLRRLCVANSGNDTLRVGAHRKGSSPERADILLWLQVANSMKQFGVQVMSVLMTDMMPDETVMRAMNKYA